MRGLVTFAKFRKREKHPWRSVTFTATLLEVALPLGFSSRFLNCINGNKLRKTSHIQDAVFLIIEKLVALFHRHSENI